MRAVTWKERIPAGQVGREIEPGVEYLIVDAASSGYLSYRSRLDHFNRLYAKATIEQKERLEGRRAQIELEAAVGRHSSRDGNCLFNLWKSPAELNKKRLLFLNAMGLGDFILLSPLLRKIKSIWPRVTIGTVCHTRYMSLLQGIPWFDAVIPYPLKVSELEGWHYQVSYERLFEDNPQAKSLHATELFGSIVGLPMRENERFPDLDPGLQPIPPKVKELLGEPKQKGEKWVGIFLKGSKPQCNWPADYILQLSHALCFAGYSVFWLGQGNDGFAVGYHPQGPVGNYFAGDMRGPAGLLDLTGKFPSLLQLAAFARDYLDLIIAPDSFGVHLGGALKKKTIALFGPFEPELLTSQYPTVLNIAGNVDCAPCHRHGGELCTYEKAGKTYQRQWCKALDEIRPELVFQQALKICPIEGQEEKERKLVYAGNS